jgi:zinc and cadmium transporter
MSQAPIFYAAVLFIAAMVGGGLFILTHKQTSKGLKLLLSFSAAYLLGLTLLHLFPELFSSEIENAGWYVLGGFMLQVVLDFFSHGVEHGHAHTNHQHNYSTKFLFTVMASLWIHAFIEGMPFGGVSAGHIHDHAHGAIGHMHTHDHRDSLLIGISLHKITETLVFTALLFSTGMSKSRVLFWMVLFALIAPAGTFVHYLIGENGIADLATLTPKVTGILIGIILHVSTIILFESEEGHKFNWMKFASILVGIAFAVLVS